MGDAEQLIAEPDELEDDDVEGVHPPSLDEQNPKVVVNIISVVLSYVATNGWYILGILVLVFIAWRNLEPKINKWLKKREEEREIAVHHKNPDVFMDKFQRMDEARQKMQEQYNMKAAISLEKKLEKEKKMKEEKIAEYDRMQSGQGYRLKPQDKSNASTSASNSSNSAKGKQTTKARMRPEYNPLTGDTGASSSCRWRPTSRGPSGGG